MLQILSTIINLNNIKYSKMPAKLHRTSLYSCKIGYKIWKAKIEK